MTAKSGEKAQKTGDFYCTRCHEKVHVRQGEKSRRVPTDTKSSEPGATSRETRPEAVADSGGERRPAHDPVGGGYPATA